MIFDFDFSRQIIHDILKHARNYKWSFQGFGMIRTYLGEGKRYRLNVWDSSLAIPNVSLIHDHPWDFESIIIAGEFTNIRYKLEPYGVGYPYNYQEIKTGIGGGPSGDIFLFGLKKGSPEVYLPSDTYQQHRYEIHSSHYLDGTVTLNRRYGDTELARTFWPDGTSWVNAEPRAAKLSEIDNAVEKALEWF